MADKVADKREPEKVRRPRNGALMVVTHTPSGEMYEGKVAEKSTEGFLLVSRDARDRRDVPRYFSWDSVTWERQDADEDEWEDEGEGEQEWEPIEQP